MSEQTDLSLVEDAPLRILKNFETKQEWILSAGDMLYLPPHLAHWGIAVGECMTYSIGFRAPSVEELAAEFLNYLQEKRVFEGRYADPDLALQAHAAEISPSMVKNVSAMLSGLKWNDEDVAEFLGEYLSEPKLHIVFDPPEHINEQAFAKKLLSSGIQLDFKSQLLFSNQAFYLNGERFDLPQSDWTCLLKLADKRALTAEEVRECSSELMRFMYDSFLAGYLTI